MLAFRFLVSKTNDSFTEISESEKKVIDSLNSQLQTCEITSSKKCPKCSEKFYILNLNDVEIDCCKKCESLWFDPDELKMVMNAADDVTDMFSHAGKAKYKCPVCQARLRKRSFLFPKKLVVDICPDGHGVYLEKGELEQVFKISNQ
jgi:Zn-finger nucleic acid-binding protein